MLVDRDPRVAAGRVPAGPRSWTHLAGRAALWAVVAVSLFWTASFAYYAAFSRFSWYDDEGYLMVSVQRYVGGSPLYDAVYSQYGPFYYIARQVLLLVLGGPPLSHDLTRFIMLASWLLIATLCALWTWRATGSRVATLVVYLQEVLYLRGLTNEPGHPQELALCLIAGAVAFAGFCKGPRRAAAFAVGAGLLVACLTLTKINLGAYLGMALLLTILTFVAGSAPQRIARVLLVVVAVGLPWALMHAFVAGWAFRYAAIASLSIAGVGVALLVVRFDRFTRRHIWYATAAGIIAAAGVCLFVIARGTSWKGLLDGVVLRPLAFSTAFYLTAWIPKWAVAWAAVSALLAGMYAAAQLSKAASRPWVRSLFWSLKLAGGVVGLDLALVHTDALFAFGPGFLWLVLIRPLRGQWSYEQLLPRVALTTTAALQTLHAYPVAGTQVAWATFLIIPAAVVCVVDALSELSVKGAAVVRPGQARSIGAALAIVAVAFCYAGRLDFADERKQYDAAVPLSLPGADRIRLPADEAARYFWLTANVRAHCGTLVTMPGLNSLYLWSQLPPPTGFNATAWMILLTRDEQRSIVDRLRIDPTACVVENDAGVRAGRRGQDIEAEPLVRFVRQNFHTAWELGPGDRPTLWIDGVAASYRLTTRAGRAPVDPNYFIYGAHSFDGKAAAVGIPSEFLISPTTATYTLWFRTSAPGVLLGCQSTPLRLGTPGAWAPLLYVGGDGRLRGAFSSGPVSPMTSASPVIDGRWHHVAIVRTSDRQAMWLDGVQSGSLDGLATLGPARYCQAGSGYTASWPAGTGAWLGFAGTIRDFGQWNAAWSAAQVAEQFGSETARTSR